MLHTVTLMSHCCSYAMYHTSVTTAPRNVFFLRSCPLFWIWLGCSPTCLVNIWKNCNNCVPRKKKCNNCVFNGARPSTQRVMQLAG